MLLALLGAVAVVALHGDVQANEPPAIPQITQVVPHEVNPEHRLKVSWLPVQKPDGAARLYYSVWSSTDQEFWVESAAGITTTSHYEKGLPKNAARYYQVRSVASYDRRDGTRYAVASEWSDVVRGRVFVFDTPEQPVVKADPESPSSAMRLEIQGANFPTTPTLDRGFAIEYRAPGGAWQPIDDGEWVGNNDEGVPNVYVHQGLRPATAYEYRVQAWYRVDNPAVSPVTNPNQGWFGSGWSPAGSGTTGPVPAPTPLAFPAPSDEWHSIAVEWDTALLPRGAENMTYSLAVSDTPDNDQQGLGGPNWSVLATGLSRPEYTHAGLEPGVVRYYRVRAAYRDSDGQRQSTGWGEVGTGKTWVIPKPVDMGLGKHEDNPHTRAVANWLDTGVPVGTTYAGWSYRLTRDDWAMSWGYIGYGLHETLAEPPLPGSNYVAHELQYLEPGQDYTFELWTRVYIEDTGQWYEGDKVSVDFSQPELNIPTGVAVAPGTADRLRSLTVAWDHDLRFETLRANGHDTYDIEVSDTGAYGSWTMLVQDARGTSYTHTGLPIDTHRHYRVRHVLHQDGGEWHSGWSAPASGQTDPEYNSPATGDPVITGTPRVGETLTVDTSGIADADGLDNAIFSYRWWADGTAISGTRGSSYTPVAGDVGKVIRVTVAFTDDAGNAERQTSADTAAVIAANSPATGALVIAGTAQVGETLTAETSGISDADGLTNASFAYQWLADGSAISGATSSAYTPVAADVGKAITVTVAFTDDAGNAETLTSAATAAVAAEDPPEDETDVTFVIYHDPDAGDAAVDRYNRAVTLLTDESITYGEAVGDIRDEASRLAGVTNSVLPRFFLGDPTASDWTSEPKVNNGGLRWLKGKVAELSGE